jgi:hypothetical protein
MKVINDIMGIDIRTNWLVTQENMTNDNDEYIRVINDIMSINIDINWIMTWEMLTKDNDEYSWWHVLITKWR